MATKIFIFLAYLWVLGIILGSPSEGVWFKGEYVSMWNAIMTFDIFDITWWGGFVPIPKLNMDWFSAVAGMMVLDFNMFEGDWQIVRWLLIIPVGIGAGVALTIVMIRTLRGAGG